MHRATWITLTFISLILLVSGCSEPATILPSISELSSDTSSPMTEVTILVTPPAGTTGRTKLSLMMLDPIAGLDIETAQLPMSPIDDGRYELKLTAPVGSTLTYRYIRLEPSKAVEVSTYFNPIDFRIVHIPGPTRIEETIAGWSDTPHSGGTGRIIGQILDLESGRGQRGLLVSSGGLAAFTEADGAFRIDGLPEGLHHISVISPDGAFSPTGQGALIAAGTTTPVELMVRKAKPIFVTFQVTVPEGLSPDTPVRLTGNISSLGNRFSDLAGGMRVSVAHMPTLVRVDPQHYLAVLSLYAGTDLHYKYTLGDGLWNAERNTEGTLLTRQVILPEHDLVIRDTVSSWGDPTTPPVHFKVTIPEDTPGDDQISIQFNPYQWFEPLPMWRLSKNSWVYDLYGPLEEGVDIQYRYCRNLQCGSADDADTSGLEASGRSLVYQGQPSVIEDDVRAWMWLGESPPGAVITAEAAIPRPELLTGVEFSANIVPSWHDRLLGSLEHIRDLGADHIVLPMNWQWEQQNPFPLLSPDPSRSLSTENVRGLIQSADVLGIETILKARTSVPESERESWWQNSNRDLEWWQLWFEEYQQFTLTAADMAAELDIEVLILGGETTAPALPGGRMPSGDPSGVPSEIEDRWRSLIEAIRSRYGGRIVFELSLGATMPELPDFLDSVDAIYLHWQVPLTSDSPGDVTQMAARLGPMLELLDLQSERFNRPLWISVEYASVQGGAAACPPAPDESCRPTEHFERGQDVDPDLKVALLEQAEAINAVLLAASMRPSIQGIFIRGFDPSAILWDKSSSIYGKPAEDVLRYWYPRLTGDQN